MKLVRTAHPTQLTHFEVKIEKKIKVRKWCVLRTLRLQLKG